MKVIEGITESLTSGDILHIVSWSLVLSSLAVTEKNYRVHLKAVSMCFEIWKLQFLQ